MDERLFKKRELVRLKSRLSAEFYSLQKEVDTLNTIIRRLNKLINENKGLDDEGIIYVEQFLLKNDSIKKKQFSWKASIIEVLNFSDQFLTCNMIFSKIKIEHFYYLNNRREAIKSISCALSNLVQSGKIGRIKEDGIYYYGSVDKHFYKNSHQPIPSYLKKARQLE